jgi:hypothetical protein
MIDARRQAVLRIRDLRCELANCVTRANWFMNRDIRCDRGQQVSHATMVAALYLGTLSLLELSPKLAPWSSVDQASTTPSSSPEI